MSDFRIGGLASGMDIDSMVNQLMDAERIPLDKKIQEKEILKWQQEDYREINNALINFRDTAFDMKLQGTYNVKNAASSDTNIAEATANSSAAAGIYEISVSQLAKSAFKTSESQIDSYTSGDTLVNQFSSVTWDGDKTGAIHINGQEIAFDASSDSIYNIVSSINEHKEETGVLASYDSSNNRFFLTTTSTGSDVEIDFTGTDTNGLNLLGNNALKIDTTTITGQDAVFTLNGADFTLSENTFNINGLDYTLNGVGDASINVTNDTSEVFTKITGFVESYNELLESINSKLQEERHRDFPPLTDAQKKEMSDNEIELWEEKARSGLLRNDNYLNRIHSNLRNVMSGIVENLNGDYNSLYSIGISTQSYHENGKLHIDESKLQTALNENSDDVIELFTNSSETSTESGIACQLYDIVDNGINSLTDKAGRETSFNLVDNSYIGKLIDNLNDEINDWEDRLIKTEDRYWSKFSAMESALNQMYSQSDWLSQQFNSGM